MKNIDTFPRERRLEVTNRPIKKTQNQILWQKTLQESKTHSAAVPTRVSVFSERSVGLTCSTLNDVQGQRNAMAVNIWGYLLIPSSHACCINTLEIGQQSFDVPVGPFELSPASHSHYDDLHSLSCAIVDTGHTLARVLVCVCACGWGGGWVDNKTKQYLRWWLHQTVVCSMMCCARFTTSCEELQKEFYLHSKLLLSTLAGDQNTVFIGDMTCHFSDKHSTVSLPSSKS